MKTLFVTVDGRVNFENLDGVETHIFAEATNEGRSGSSSFPNTLIHSVAERLGFVVEAISDENRKGALNPFQWLDLRYGNGGPFDTPNPKDGHEVLFLKVKGYMDETERKRRAHGEPYWESDKSYYMPPAGGWPEPYIYVLDPSGLSPIEQDLIRCFLPMASWSGGTRFDGYFQMHTKGAAEVARRLGYVPKFDEEFSS